MKRLISIILILTAYTSVYAQESIGSLANRYAPETYTDEFLDTVTVKKTLVVNTTHSSVYSTEPDSARSTGIRARSRIWSSFPRTSV